MSDLRAWSIVECVKAKSGADALLGFTGPPGVGKSTIFSKIIAGLKELGCKVGGIAAPEVRTGSSRAGFKIVDLMSGEEGWLAKRGSGPPGAPRVGRYYVVEDDVIRIGVPALRKAVERADVIGIDEIGPMELTLAPLRDAIVSALASQKPKVVVFHRRLRSSDPEVYRLVSKGCTVEVSIANRSALGEVAPRLAEALAEKAGCR